MKELILSLLKYISLPFALLYGLVILLRNKFYDWKIFDSIAFNLPVICVGNITVGGTGKSPHIEYLIEQLKNEYQVATLSRGYRRHTRGFKLADANSNARDIGDEPFQFKSKYPSIEVCVAEERMTAIPELLQRKQDIQVILLDDAFQHRTVKAGLNILLTDYDRLFTKDFIMPFGLLRESRSAYKRADIVIITKCPQQLTADEKQKLITEINPLIHQQVYFSAIDYANIYALTPFQKEIGQDTEVLLVTGIANPKPLQEKLEKEFKKVHCFPYKDHHYFSIDDLNEMKDAFNHIATSNKIIITTEKDAARLMLLKDAILEMNLPFYAQAIRIHFLFNEDELFNEKVKSFVAPFYPFIEDEVFTEEEEVDLDYEEIV